LNKRNTDKTMGNNTRYIWDPADAHSASAFFVPRLSLPISTSEPSPWLKPAQSEDQAYKALVEAYAVEAFFRDTILSQIPRSDPFDAIYLSELQPDAIGRCSYERLVEFSSIRDISDQIEFDDGLDD